MCTVLLPPAVNPTSVNKYIMSYHIISSYRIISYHNAVSSCLASHQNATRSRSRVHLFIGQHITIFSLKIGC